MWEKIKKILSKEGGKCIIIENDQSTYLVTKWEDAETKEINHEVNRSIDHWKAEEDAEKEPEVNKTDEEKPEVKIEDLPF